MVQVPGLRRVRELKLMTIRELAAAAGVSPNTVFRIEHGKPAELRTIRKLAAALAVKPAELMAPAPESGEAKAA